MDGRRSVKTKGTLMSSPSTLAKPDFDLRSGDPFSTDERDAVYKAIFTRRDVRSEFLPDPIAPDVLSRILTAAHHAPSVGLSQPWNFLVISQQSIKQEIAAIFARANAEAEAMFAPEKRDKYRSLKLEGITSAPFNICVTSDRRRGGPTVLGATHMKDTDLFSTVCAIQNLWLAARAEGIGIGWVSILKETEVKSVLGIPDEIKLVGYLCLGRVKGFFKKPELEQRGWRKRTPITELVFEEAWGAEPDLLRDELERTERTLAARADA